MERKRVEGLERKRVEGLERKGRGRKCSFGLKTTPIMNIDVDASFFSAFLGDLEGSRASESTGWRGGWGVGEGGVGEGGAGGVEGGGGGEGGGEGGWLSMWML